MLCRASTHCKAVSLGVLWGSLCGSCCRALRESKDLGLSGVEAVEMLQSFWKKLQHCSGLSSSAGPLEGKE